MAGDPWSDAENDATVAAYFALRADGDLVKSAVYRDVARQISRSAKAVEFKFQNVSSVLDTIGMDWVGGLPPRHNIQLSLADAVGRYLAQFSEVPLHQPTGGMAEAGGFFIAPAPHRRNAPPSVEDAKRLEVSIRLGMADRDAANRALGQAGEAAVVAHERAALTDRGRPDLAARVEWTARDQGDGAGYDVRSFEVDGRDRLIEVKTTNGWERTPFHITRNELAVAEDNRDTWHLVRLWNFRRGVRAYALRPPLEAHVALTATDFRADLH
ncbi:DUF3883 domain-containing protein [Jannaschia pohangensis]|uniref:Protein NO VEIN C-terminal domain-containing protein n=1 Tax=Jannaschia pohangensis TaxID=390807 RepID=A0A1I3MNQ2_9RHOB|nr:DUF3883 domain-containing protein [Jannaschia pohangensis]SFI98589.1 protein of unknown function [Jannaschia pohangensis]